MFFSNPSYIYFPTEYDSGGRERERERESREGEEKIILYYTKIKI